MIFTIIIVVVSLILLMVLHELGHFLMAKKFGVKVEEFGVGYPPKIWGKKIGETIYSINWLPFGAFVKILGEDDNTEKTSGSFASKKIWQRALILIGGVVSFWVIAFILLVVVIAVWGVPASVPDDFQGQIGQTNVRVLSVASHSPAQEAGMKAGDIIISMQNLVDSTNKESSQDSLAVVDKIDKVGMVLNFVDSHRGKTILLNLQRGSDYLGAIVIPRVSPPKGEGAIGIALARVAELHFPWYEIPWQSLKITAQKTKEIPVVLYDILSRKIKGEKISGVEFVGPIGLGQIMGQAMTAGFQNFLMMVIMISIWMALFNLVPIPALDGGRILFLVIESVKRKPVSQQIEQRITATFFFLLICLMAVVTVRDIIRIF